MNGPELILALMVAGFVLLLLWAKSEPPAEPKKPEPKVPTFVVTREAPMKIDVKPQSVVIDMAARRRDERLQRGATWDDADQPIGCRLDPTATENDYLEQVATMSAMRGVLDEPAGLRSESDDELRKRLVAVDVSAQANAGAFDAHSHATSSGPTHVPSAPTHHEPAPVHHEPAPSHDNSNFGGGGFDGGSGGGFDGGHHGGHF